MGYPRLELKEQAEKLADLIGCLEGRSTSHQDKYVVIPVYFKVTLKILILA